MQLLPIFILISGAILNVSGKPSPPIDLSENSQATNATKQEVLKVYLFEISNSSINNEPLKNSSSQNKTANNVEILTEEDISERASSQDLHPIDNEGRKRGKRTLYILKEIIEDIINNLPMQPRQPRQPTYVIFVGGSGNNNYNIEGVQYHIDQSYYRPY